MPREFFARAVALGAVATMAFVPAPTAQAYTSFPVAPNTSSSARTRLILTKMKPRV